MEEDIKVLSENGAKLLLKQTKEYINVLDNEINNKFDNEIKDINSSIIANKDTIKNIKKNTDCIKSTIPTFSDDEQYHVFNIRAVNDYNFNFFRICYNVDKTYGTGRNFLSINYPYVKKSYNISKSASAIYIADDIRFRSFPIFDDVKAKTLAVFNTDKTYIKNTDCIVFLDNNNNGIKLNFRGILLDTFDKRIKIHDRFNDNVIFLNRSKGVYIKSKNKIKLYSDKARMILKPNELKIGIDSLGKYLKYRLSNNDGYDIFSGLTIENFHNGTEHYRIRLNDVAGLAMLLSTNSKKSYKLVYDFNGSTNTLIESCLRNTLYYPKSAIHDEFSYLIIDKHINNRLAINCISVPNYVSETKEIYAHNILELNGHEINIGTKLEGQLNVNYTSEFNELTKFNSSIIFSKSNNSGDYCNIIDKYNHPFLINKEIQDYSNNRINQVNAYFCTLYKDNSNSVKLLKLTPTVGFLILKKSSGVLLKKAVEYNLENDIFTIKTRYINLESLLRLVIKSDGGVSVRSTDNKSGLQVNSNRFLISHSENRLVIDNEKIELTNKSSKTHKILFYNDKINVLSDGYINISSCDTITLRTKENINSVYKPTFELSSNRVHLDDCLGTAMLDNKVINTYGNTETYLNYPEILSTASNTGVLVDTEHAIKLQRNLASNPNGEFIGNSTLTLNGNNVYLDGFKSDATLSTILSSEFGSYFSSSDNGYKCDLLNLIKAILIKLIS